MSDMPQGRSVPWLKRLPTVDEVAAHEKAHPAIGELEGAYWLEWIDSPVAWVGSPQPSLVRIMAKEGMCYGHDPEMDEWYGIGPENCGDRYLPCTAEGLPVCFMELSSGELINRAARLGAHAVEAKEAARRVPVVPAPAREAALKKAVDLQRQANEAWAAVNSTKE